MGRKALTAIEVAAEKPGDKRREIPDGKIGGLYLVVQPSGAKSWAFRYRSAGQPKKLTIGAFPAIDLAAARKAAVHAMSSVAQGEDPASQKRETREAVKAKRQEEKHTVRKVVDSFIARHVEPNTRPSSAAEVKRLLKVEAVPFWGDRAISSITRADIHARLDQLVDRGAAVMANRFLGAFRKMCGWALERGIIDRNPCEGIKPPTAENSRDRILTDDELREVWHAAGALDWPFGPIVRLLILTGQRRGEVTDMRWSEVDIEKRTWTIPKERVKNGVEHVVALSTQAVEILETLPTIKARSGLVFTMTTVTAVSGHSRAKRRLDALVEKQRKNDDTEAAPMPSWVLHDLRRTVASGMARLGINLPVIEKVLNHVSGSFGGIVAVYQRHSFDAEKRTALEAWGRHVEAVVNEKVGDNVVPMQVRA